MNAFIFSALKKCSQAIQDKLQKNGSLNVTPLAWLREQGASWFREKMTEGQSIECQGRYRIDFYDSVIAEAQQVGQLPRFSLRESTDFD